MINIQAGLAMTTSRLESKHPENQKMEPQVQAKIIHNKIINYLTLCKDRDPKFIAQFERGYCQGESVFWSFCQYIDTQPNITGKARDDKQAWNNTINTIMNCPDKDLLSIKEIMEPFIAKIQFLQKPYLYLANITHDDSATALSGSDTLKRNFFDEAFLFMDVQNSHTIQKTIEENANKIILIHIYGHTMAIFNNGKEVMFYDPRRGEHGPSQAKDMAQFIANYIYKEFRDNNIQTICMHVNNDKEAKVVKVELALSDQTDELHLYQFLNFSQRVLAFGVNDYGANISKQILIRIIELQLQEIQLQESKKNSFSFLGKFFEKPTSKQKEALHKLKEIINSNFPNEFKNKEDGIRVWKKINEEVVKAGLDTILPTIGLTKIYNAFFDTKKHFETLSITIPAPPAPTD